MNPETVNSSTKQKNNKIVNLNLFKIKKSLLDEGFEIVENADGKITLVIRVAK